MFTGLVECMGALTSIDPNGSSVAIGIKPDIREFIVDEGGSVSVDGVCLTLDRKAGPILYFCAVRETLQRSTFKTLSAGRLVNLERAMRLGGRLDGHLVLGHVDGVGEIIKDLKVGGSILRTIKIPSKLSRFMAEKGSVAVDGISLTVASVMDDFITVSLIPATMKRTTLAGKGCGDQVNLECDVLARYLDRLLADSGRRAGSTDASLLTKMEGLGF